MELKETEKRLLEAVSKIIEEEGFTTAIFYPNRY